MQVTKFSESEIHRIRASFERVWPHGGEHDHQHVFLSRFYRRFFDTSPELESLFSGVEMRAQRRMLFTTLKAVVHNLENPGELKAYLNKLGAAHRDYGALDRYYEPFTQCLLTTMAEVDADSWTTETAAIWRKALRLVCDIMLEGYSADAE